MNICEYMDINKRRMPLIALWCGCFSAETLKAGSIK